MVSVRYRWNIVLRPHAQVKGVLAYFKLWPFPSRWPMVELYLYRRTGDNVGNSFWGYCYWRHKWVAACVVLYGFGIKVRVS